MTSDGAVQDASVQIIFPDDPHEMSWLRPDHPYAQVRLPAPVHAESRPPLLHAEVMTQQVGDETRTRCTIANPTDRPVMVPTGELAITLPLRDLYDDPALCLTSRCHVHLSTAGTSSYVLARRMGGDGPHLGLVLTEGELAAYSIERDTARSSNDRGLFLLHPGPLELAPGQAVHIGWSIFPCGGPEDFFSQALDRAPFVHTRWDRHVLFPGEEAHLEVETSAPGSISIEGARILGEAEPLSPGRRRIRAVLAADAPGERTVTVRVGAHTARTRLLVKEPLAVLLERRTAFLVEHQQYDGPWEPLRGALLAYDTEDRRIFYDRAGDFNGGRERVGMGILLAEQLRALRDGIVEVRDADLPRRLRGALDRYAAYVRRELVDVVQGHVFDDAGQDRPGTRLYNAPWFARFFLSLWELDHDAADVELAARIIERFYADGGGEFYPIQLPVLELVAALDAAGLPQDRDRLRNLFLAHARRLAERGTGYPAIEVVFEQSIVAPAADILLQAHLLSGDPILLAAARAHLHVLDQFQGVQSDHHLHEVAIRHWDGYWFGKRKLYGDTLPHYWSGLTGNVLALAVRADGDEALERRADAALRAVLPLIHDDGTATAAHLFPMFCNGERAALDDPLANDQDWALVFALRRLRERPGFGG
ncbi:hypothetical protein [Brachybacterium hainanense]|uniref:Uncharacterized protein n=1 Tax=Brachybacterium hainanense TaxID=1541174 RepID=A0ABV6R6H1_9MICO